VNIRNKDSVRSNSCQKDWIAINVIISHKSLL